MIEEAIALAERYEPDYARKIRRATEQELLELEQHVGRRLPEYHREFLSRMGKDMGGLQAEDVSFEIEEVLNFYRGGSWLPPEGYILLGVHLQDPYLDYYLECVESGAQDCPVVRFPSEGEFSRQYFFPLEASLKDFLLAQIFIRKRMADFESRWSFLSVPKGERTDAATDPERLARVLGERARKLGFEEIVQSSANYHFFDRQDAAIITRRAPEEGVLAMTIAAKALPELARITDILGDGTPLKRMR